MHTVFPTEEGEFVDFYPCYWPKRLRWASTLKWLLRAFCCKRDAFFWSGVFYNFFGQMGKLTVLNFNHEISESLFCTVEVNLMAVHSFLSCPNHWLHIRLIGNQYVNGTTTSRNFVTSIFVLRLSTPVMELLQMKWPLLRNFSAN